MADYDSDESNIELLIQHSSLADVLAFVIARDDVRRIPSPPLERDENDDMLAPPSRQTMPAAVGRIESLLVESSCIESSCIEVGSSCVTG